MTLYLTGSFKIAAFAEGSNPFYWSELQDLIGVMDIVADPDWSYTPYGESVVLGSLATFGRGFPIAAWHWNGLRDYSREQLRTLVPSPAITAKVYICTPTNESTSGDLLWLYALAQMHWPAGDEDKQPQTTQDFDLRFTILEELVP